MIGVLRRFLGRAGSARSTASYPGLPDGRVVYAIGDLHGRADLLAQTFAAIDADRQYAPEREVSEIYLGDYIDRGPESARVLDMLIARRQRAGVLCLAGNHESVLLDLLNGRGDYEAWAALGGRETLLSYGLSPVEHAALAERERREALRQAVPAAHVAFLATLLLSHHNGPYFFAHAGIRPGVALDAQTPRDLLWIRRAFLDFDGALPAIVVHGHTPTPEPAFCAYRINIDTGAYMTNRLTCLRIDAHGPALLDTAGVASAPVS